MRVHMYFEDSEFVVNAIDVCHVQMSDVTRML